MLCDLPNSTARAASFSCNVRPGLCTRRGLKSDKGRKNMSEGVLNVSEAPARSEGYVVVRGGVLGFAQEIQAGRHRFQADEPIVAGGTNTGPTPYDFLLAALGS